MKNGDRVVVATSQAFDALDGDGSLRFVHQPIFAGLFGKVNHHHQSPRMGKGAGREAQAQDEEKKSHKLTLRGFSGARLRAGNFYALVASWMSV